MLRNSGYTRSASRPRAASSPPFQALSKFVISREGLSMGCPVLLLGITEYQKTWPLLPSDCACTSGRRTSSQNDLLQNIGGSHEMYSNHGTDAQSRCRRRLSTTKARKDD